MKQIEYLPGTFNSTHFLFYTNQLPCKMLNLLKNLDSFSLKPKENWTWAFIFTHQNFHRFRVGWTQATQVYIVPAEQAHYVHMKF